ncbi:MAG: 3-hydroxybenzoate synthase [Candidatus Ordinivivax streblomastigis]|uniref:3-hydroxybenzoate synthase n=1 Tax=Candidatus Ordinivivax streblomastigis TaxID=2540710 RepID=A0A5M8P4I0_9BACT|nr:MAG: 3-hydroxybenzoate synthase [Candidatus Ordinivivax streblomastigis]KAA6303415.1 MAG: 3-hydroxybenzoate synthase [Candidatus Ordinivivax streblomastigis]
MFKRNYFYIEQQSHFADTVTMLAAQLQKGYSLQALMGITVFISASDNAGFSTKRQMIRQTVSQFFDCLPVACIAQPVGEGIAVEVWTHDTCRNLRHKATEGIHITTCEDSFGKSIWVFGICAEDIHLPFHEQATFAFEKMQALLASEGFTMDDIVRQWNYIPQILQTVQQANCLYQHYQVFNDIRQYYYGQYKSNGMYPAATGIGMQYGTVAIDFYAVKKADAVIEKALNNPNQINAFQYGQAVLVGSPFQADETKKAPLFERAKYLASANEALTFISGTASIIGEKTIGGNDIAEQTRTTLRNMLQFMDPENLQSAGIERSKPEYSYLRCYVKNTEDIPAVQKICEEQTAVPVLYVQADICRDDLLVEIEGEAVFS